MEKAPPSSIASGFRQCEAHLSSVRLKPDPTGEMEKACVSSRASGVLLRASRFSSVASGFSRTARRGLILVGAVLALAAAGCGSSGTGTASTPPAASGSAAPASRSSLRPVTLPDVSKLEGPAQQQLKDGYAALTARTGNAATSDFDLGYAYGEMGKLLMAAEYRDAAEPAFLNAQALTPNEIRWPYYLAQLYKLKGDATRATASFERALQIKPDDLPTLIWLGSAYLDQGRAAEAEPLFTRALALDPRSIPALP